MANVIKHKRGSGSDPSASNLVVGELAIRTDTGKLFTKMDSGSIAEIAGGGSDIAINTLSSSSATGGGSATFNGSAYRFTLSSPPSVSAAQLLVSINGVIQKPVAGTGQPSEGFSVSGNDIILGDAPATGSDFFILTFRSLGVSEPADNSVTSAKIVDGAIVNADINASAAIAGSKISPDFGSQDITTTGDLTISGGDFILNGTYPNIRLIDTNNDSDYRVVNANGDFQIYDISNSATRFSIDGNTGNIGIGTENPTCGLHIDNPSNAAITQILDTDNSAVKIVFRNNTETGNNVQIGADGSNLVALTNATERLRIKSDGDILLTRQTAGGGSNETLLISANYGAGSDQALQASNNLRFYTNGANERIRIDTSGNVGIGTTSPDVGNSAYKVVQVHSSSTNAYFKLSNDTTGSGSGDGVELSLSGSDAFLTNRESANLIFRTAATERMRIGSDGRVMINTTSDTFDGVTGNLNIANDNFNNHTVINLSRNTTADRSQIRFSNPNGNVGSISTSGSATSYNTSSDYRLKENVTAISDGITRLKTLKPYRFNFKVDATTTVDGFFAHEVTAVPEAITGTKDKVDENNDPVYQGIDQSKLVPLLVAALQEAIGRIEALEAK